MGPDRRRRVVVTGLGCVTPLGPDGASSWQAAIGGRSGIAPLAGLDASDLPVRFGGEVRVPLDAGLPPKEARRLDRVALLAHAAAREALAEAALEPALLGSGRVGVAIGSGIGGLGTLEEAFRTLLQRGPARVSPFTIPMSLASMPAGSVAIRHGIVGPNLCHVSACASGAHSLGEAARTIERGDADVMLAGGAEAAITRLGISAFAAMRALSRHHDAPERASRPFDRDRDGFVIGEGAAVLVLEEAGHARGRGARVRAELLGYGTSADAQHVAQPAEDGAGARRCMELALLDAGLAASDVDYLNAHATSTPAGDPSEVRAIRAVFGAHADALAVSATKSMTGHLLGAAGALEALFCVRALETGILPPTINLEHVAPGCELDHVSHKARERRIQVALSNSFGFGGTNAALVFGRA